MTELREIIRNISKDLSEDDVYAFEKEIRDATLINIGYFPRAKKAMCEKYAMKEDAFDFFLWASCKDKIYKALIQAEHDDVRIVQKFLTLGISKGYFKVMNKVMHRGLYIPKFYEVLPPLKDFQREFLSMLNPEFIEKNAKTFYRESPMWVRKNLARSEKLYYENVIFANKKFSIK